ncbi:MAG: cytochrome c biogenesis heme-transporting ATPase CcmA [Pseudomonadota bacterium]
MTTKLSATGLTLLRGERLLFRDLEFALNPGELLLLEGKNGSGKTSLLRVIAGLLEPESGEIRWDGKRVRSSRQEFQNAFIWMGHAVGMKNDLTLLENLQFEARLQSPSAAEFKEVLSRLGLNRLKNLPMRALSAGQRRRVALARLLLSEAAVWLMDEPVANLDTEGRKLVIDLVEDFLNSGGMVVMAAHQDVDVEAPTHTLELS